MIVPAKQFEGELWVKATDYNRAIAAVKGQQAVGAAWQGLTDEEVLEILGDIDADTKRLPPGIKAFARAIEAQLKEKNT